MLDTLMSLNQLNAMIADDNNPEDVLGRALDMGLDVNDLYCRAGPEVQTYIIQLTCT